MSKINVLIAGSTGYIGVQLTKILVNHKKINIKYLCGSSSIGKKISYFDKSLSKYKLPKIIKFNKNLLLNVDVIFTALPNGESQKISKLLLKKNTLSVNSFHRYKITKVNKCFNILGVAEDKSIEYAYIKKYNIWI